MNKEKSGFVRQSNVNEIDVRTKNIKNEASNITITESLSSVKLTRTAGGEIRPEVKVYHVDPVEAGKIAQTIMDELNKKYKVNK